MDSKSALPLSIVIGPANEHDSVRFVDCVDAISVGKQHRIPDVVYADKAYDSESIRRYLKSYNIKARIPARKFCNAKSNNNNKKKYNYANYGRSRSAVERFFAWMKCGFRRISTRYERSSDVYMAFVNIAVFVIYSRVLR